MVRNLFFFFCCRCFFFMFAKNLINNPDKYIFPLSYPDKSNFSRTVTFGRSFMRDGCYDMNQPITARHNSRRATDVPAKKKRSR